ncbi:uncharacterized protein CCOS01_12804 [Colletotrichum costaricense]|uniref:Cyclin-D1-binding protein 1-like N-terminal domain-containing protein n=2 Tax=Colletotrichum acutatum species complex TaxID=2707335 RepID=A0AAI9YLN0_9PEZI|nr:uncharacterized protein CCOS01_12804 [Colletotrichum costaricense]XP_060373852.1 uncharacterized protein CTAM01_15585 [Colletotrichum tamarilloi]KAK1475919.1 hypothetical protein CTAM01_15585 [Colletotrichum tamarilloi]KAK1515606.1 hypothetical protein CCOS01_12804 [Colletotrichum costaricense]
MASSNSSTTPAALNALSDTAVVLMQQLEAVLQNINSGKDTPQQTDTSSVDAFALARDSATLIKAHSTKISVLIINEPFTPSAVIKVLRELVGGPIPGIATAGQACDADRYTATVRKDLAWKCYTVLKELRGLVEKIPRDGKILSTAQKSGSTGAPGKGSMAATGVIWSACDDLVQFATGGIGGCFIKKVEEFRATLKDVMEELKEWGDEEPEDDEDDDDDDDDDDNAVNDADHDSALGSMMPSAQEMIDDMMANQGTIPRDDPDKIRERLESCLKRVRLTTLLYQAIIKRRLKTLPSLPVENSDIPKRLDESMRVLRKLPHMFDELAGAFYELSPDEIDRVMKLCFDEIVGLSELLKSPWTGESDEFSQWVGKFQAEIKKG